MWLFKRRYIYHNNLQYLFFSEEKVVTTFRWPNCFENSIYWENFFRYFLLLIIFNQTQQKADSIFPTPWFYPGKLNPPQKYIHFSFQVCDADRFQSSLGDVINIELAHVMMMFGSFQIKWHRQYFCLHPIYI